MHPSEPDIAAAPRRPPPVRGALVALGVWTLLALSYSLTGVLSALAEGHAPSWARTATWNFTNFYLWAALTPLVAWLGRRTAGVGWRRFVLVHVPAGLLLAAAQTLLMLAVFWSVCGPGTMPARTFGEYLPMEFVYCFHLSLLIYWVLLVVLRALDTRRRLEDERVRSERLRTQLAQAQLQTLRVQLQPHFLFNTLNAVATLAQSQPARARVMIARLSDLLRLTLEERDAQHVPLAREMEVLECYLAIQRIRFEDRLRVELDIAADTRAARVPGMILQPLVENALRHGLLDRPIGGTLRVASRRDGATLHLCVEDDGIGLPAGGVREGIGLSTTRARLDGLYGAEADLRLRSRGDGGTCVELRLPYRTET